MLGAGSQSSSRATRRPENEVSAAAAKHSRVAAEFSINWRERSLLLVITSGMPSRPLTLLQARVVGAAGEIEQFRRRSGKPLPSAQLFLACRQRFRNWPAADIEAGPAIPDTNASTEY